MLATNFLKLKKDQELWPPFNASIFAQGAGWYSYHFLGKFFQNKRPLSILVLNKSDKKFAYILENKPREISEEFFQKYLKNPQVLGRAIKKYGQYQKRICQAYEELDYAAINKISYSSLLKKIDSLWDDMRNFNAVAWFSIIFDKELCLKVIAAEKFLPSPKNLDKIWERGIKPSKPSFDKAQKKYFLELASRGESLDSLAEQCQYFYASYVDVKNLEFTKRRLKEDYAHFFNPQSARAEIKRENKTQGRILFAHEKWLKGLNRREKTLVDYFQKIIWLRDDRKNNILMGLTILWRTAERMLREAGLSTEYIPYYSYAEIKKGLVYLKKNKNKIKQRKNGAACLAHYNGRLEIKNEDFAKNFKIMEEAYAVGFSGIDKKIINGQTGSKGCAKGIARIMLDADRADSFQAGDVLVTGMTRPEFVPLMKKAAAIITDEGGITCHAAIVSRELGIPCVIGTKFATKIIKDGDEVEVNANKGTVKILKRA